MSAYFGKKNKSSSSSSSSFDSGLLIIKQNYAAQIESCFHAVSSGNTIDICSRGKKTGSTQRASEEKKPQVRSQSSFLPLLLIPSMTDATAMQRKKNSGLICYSWSEIKWPWRRDFFLCSFYQICLSVRGGFWKTRHFLYYIHSLTRQRLFEETDRLSQECFSLPSFTPSFYTRVHGRLRRLEKTRLRWSKASSSDN